jgi:hypothetical protein
VTGKMVAIYAGRLSVSRITYICDLQQASASVLPLGVMAELTIGNIRALGLIARTTLDLQEVSSVGRILREKLSAPFEFLRVEFDWALSETAPGEALSALARRYSESLFFAPPQEERIRRVLSEDPAATDAVIEDLRRRRDEEFKLMIAELWGRPQIVARRDTLQLAA